MRLLCQKNKDFSFATMPGFPPSHTPSKPSSPGKAASGVWLPHLPPPTSHTLHSGILSSNSASPTSIRTWGHIRQTRQLISRQLGPWILISSSVRFLALFPRLIKAGYSGRLRVRGVDVASLAQSWRAGEEDWGWSS